MENVQKPSMRFAITLKEQPGLWSGGWRSGLGVLDIKLLEFAIKRCSGDAQHQGRFSDIALVGIQEMSDVFPFKILEG